MCPIIIFQPKCHPMPSHIVPPVAITFHDAAMPPINKFSKEIGVDPGECRCKSANNVDCRVMDRIMANVAA
jgi:hypothetical protein